MTVNVILGWMLDYRGASAYLAFWGLSALLLVTAWSVTARVFTPVALRLDLAWGRWGAEQDSDPGLDDWIDACIRTSIVAFAIIVLCGLVLGAIGRLTVGWYVVGTIVCLAGSFLLPSRLLSSRSRPSPCLATLATPAAYAGRARIPPFVVGIVGATLAFAVAFAATHAPLTLYDGLSYHLFFASRWLQDRALSIVPTPFSDEAQAYAPANGELFLLWLMLPFHGDLLARMGQLPFALLGAVTLYALARRLGASPQHAIYPSAFFVLSRPVLEQAIGANVDLICASMFLTALYLGTIALQGHDWALWGVSVGLYAGSKYLALVYAPVLLLLVLARGTRFKALIWALPGIAVLALPWYARNWVVAGSPIYPATLKIAGYTLARGAFTREAMLNTVFHTTDLRLFPVMAAHGLGPTLLVVWLPLFIIGVVNMARRGWWPAGFLGLVPLLMVPLYWFGFPVNIDSRFLMPAVGPALLPLGFAFRSRRAWNTAVHVVYAAGMVWILVGIRAQIPVTLPWFMSGWLALDGLVRREFAGWFAMLAALVGATWWITARASRWAFSLTASGCLLSAMVLAVGADHWCAPATCDYLETTSPHIRPNLLHAWRWVADHTMHSTIAYTGINLPYPLTGKQLTNRVVYANIDGRLRWRFHDYDRAYRGGRFNPIPPILAASSGELIPISQRPGPRDDAVRPRYERMQGVREAWLDNLQRLRAGYLFVSALSPYEIDYVWHNDRGFPIEDEWAKGDSRVFQLVYENPQVHIYAVDFLSVNHA